MIKKPLTKDSRPIIKDWLLCLLIALPILFILIPMLNLGTDNFNMVRHFDRDESDLIEFAGKTYSHGLIPLEKDIAYPQLFYYASGIFLFPYTLLKGIDYHLIIVYLRSFNLLMVFISLIFTYFFALRFFKSRFAAFLSCLLLATNKQIFWLAVNSRPHLLSMFFILAAFYCCFKIVEKYQKGVFILAGIFTGLAAATNLFGIFLIPSLSIALFYSFTKEKTADLLTGLKSKFRLIYALSFSLICTAAIIPAFCIFMYFKRTRWFNFIGIYSLQQFLNFRNFKILLLACMLVIAIGILWFVINYFTSVSVRKHTTEDGNRPLLLFDKSILYSVLLIIGTGLVFLCTNPAYFLFPIQNIKTLLVQLAQTTMGPQLNYFRRPIFDFNASQWFLMLFDNNVFNVWFGILLLAYALYEIFNFKNNWKRNRDFVMQRILIWVFVLFLFLVLFICVSHRPHHYLLPMVPLLGVLIAFGINETMKWIRITWLRWLCMGIFSGLLLLGFYFRFQGIFEFWRFKKQCNSGEFGMIIGKWLQDKFPRTATIWKDSQDFYIPSYFDNIDYIKAADNITQKYSDIIKINPDILVITSEFDLELKNAQNIEKAINVGVLRNYKKIKIFKYSGPLELGKTDHGKYKEIVIYAR